MSLIALKIGTLLKRTNTLTRFLLVGVINTLTGLSVIFLLLNVVELSYWFSTFVGNAVGAFVSYLLNRNFTFHSDVRFNIGFFKFVVVILICYICSYAMSSWLMDKLASTVVMVRFVGENNLAVLVGSLFYTVSNYLGQKYVVFRK